MCGSDRAIRYTRSRGPGGDLLDMMQEMLASTEDSPEPYPFVHGDTHHVVRFRFTLLFTSCRAPSYQLSRVCTAAGTRPGGSAANNRHCGWPHRPPLPYALSGPMQSARLRSRTQRQVVLTGLAYRLPALMMGIDPYVHDLTVFVCSDPDQPHGSITMSTRSLSNPYPTTCCRRGVQPKSAAVEPFLAVFGTSIFVAKYASGQM